MSDRPEAFDDEARRIAETFPDGLVPYLLAEVARWKKRAEDNEQDSDYVAAVGEQLTAEVNAHEATKAEVARLRAALAGTGEER